ncbi:MAG: hypothetical protein QW666_01005 [Candidatus Woesearchaeota archaeon]
MAKKEEKCIPKFIFQYSLRHLPKKDKVRFYYALKGRDGKSGIMHSQKIEQLAKTVLLVSEKAEQNVAEFLTFWKCNFKKRKVFVEK